MTNTAPAPRPALAARIEVASDDLLLAMEDVMFSGLAAASPANRDRAYADYLDVVAAITARGLAAVALTGS